MLHVSVPAALLNVLAAGVGVQEAKDREWRNKERASAERQAAMMADLAAAREAQMRGKLIAQSQMAEVEQEEFKRVLRVNQERQAQEMSQVCDVKQGYAVVLRSNTCHKYSQVHCCSGGGVLQFHTAVLSNK